MTEQEKAKSEGPQAPKVCPCACGAAEARAQAKKNSRPPVRQNANAHLPVVNYHGLYVKPGDYGFTAGEAVYALGADEFCRQLDAAKAAGYRPLDLAGLKDWFDYRTWDAKPLLLTFDDGHASHYDLARPHLKDRGMKAVFFVSAGLAGTPGMMTWAQIRELAGEGFDIGSHGMNHVPLTGVSNEALCEEIAGSKKRIEDETGRPVRAFSVPRGFFSPRIQDVARAAGYEFLFTSEFGVNYRSEYALGLKRMAVKQGLSIVQFRHRLDGNPGAVHRCERIKEAVRNSVPPAWYDKLAAAKRFLLKPKGKAGS